MPLNTEQVARLYSAGSVPLPSAFPEPGHVTAEENSYTLPGRTTPETSLRVVHYPSPANKNTYIVPLSEVTALYLPDGLTPGAGPTWYLGDLLRSGQVNLEPLTVGGGRPGSVFVEEQSGVLVTAESAKTAAEIASYPRNCL